MLKSVCAQVTIPSMVALLLLMSCTPSPEQFAAATATVLRAQNVATQDAQVNTARATADAGNAYATATAAGNDARATSIAVDFKATLQASQVEATMTVLPSGVSAGIAKNNADGWNATIVPIAFASVILILVGLAFAASQVLRREAVTLRRDKNGQLPLLYDRGVLVNPARAVGPAVLLPQSDLLAIPGRIQRWIKTGELPEPATPQVITTDNGATADQLLLAAQADAQATGIASMFQPGESTQDRDDKIKTAQNARLPVGVLSGESITPPPRVLVIDENKLQALAQGNATFVIEPPTSEPTHAQGGWTEEPVSPAERGAVNPVS